MFKLFDLQTGEYLGLGKDWLDGEDYIVILAKSHTANPQVFDYLKDSSFRRSPSHELNTKWCGVFNHCVYGDRYVKIKNCDIFKYYRNGHVIVVKGKNKEIFFPINTSEISDINDVDKFFKGNLLEEYSKFTHDKENILEELDDILSYKL